MNVLPAILINTQLQLGVVYGSAHRKPFQRFL